MAPAAKRAKTNEAAKPKEAAKSPKDAHFERLHAKITELGALGLGVCESDCGRMWDMVCSRWRQLHDEESPACGDYTYFVNRDNPRGVAPPDETS